MRLKIERWDEALGFRIPAEAVERLGLKEGTVVEIIIENDRLALLPVPRHRYSLDEMLEGITPENIHPAVDWGPPVGNEWTAQCVGNDY